MWRSTGVSFEFPQVWAVEVWRNTPVEALSLWMTTSLWFFLWKLWSAGSGTSTGARLYPPWMPDDVLLRLEIEVDRETVARRHARRVRRASRRSDRWWAFGIGLFSLAMWVLTGPSLLWWLGLLAAGLFLVGDVLERRAIDRELAAIPPDERRRVLAVGEDEVSLTTAAGAPIVAGRWREVERVRRQGGHYTLVLNDEHVEIPLEAFPSEVARGAFEAVAARNDRPVEHG